MCSPCVPRGTGVVPNGASATTLYNAISVRFLFHPSSIPGSTPHHETTESVLRAAPQYILHAQ